MKNIEFHNEPQIFTTGAYLSPMKVIDSEGKEIWVWFVSDFIDSSFKNGEEYNPRENANTLNDLVSEIF